MATLLRAVVFDTLAVAVIFRNRVDARLGYPIAAVKATGGIHGPQVDAQHHSPIYKHPLNSQWAHVIEGIGRPHLAVIQAQAQARISAANPQAGDPEIVAVTEQDLDGTWGV